MAGLFLALGRSVAELMVAVKYTRAEYTLGNPGEVVHGENGVTGCERWKWVSLASPHRARGGPGTLERMLRSTPAYLRRVTSSWGEVGTAREDWRVAASAAPAARPSYRESPASARSYREPPRGYPRASAVPGYAAVAARVLTERAPPDTQRG
jgi:hypothetical protein